MIHLQHFIHGTKIAISEQEAQYDEKSGWVRFTPLVPKPVDVFDNEVVPIENALHRNSKKK